MFVVDAAGLSRNSRLIRDLDAEHMLVEQVEPDRLAAHRFVAVDVDLTDAGSVRALRTAMRGRRHGFFQAFAIDLHRRLETIHARIIGATDLTRRPFHGRDLVSRIAAFKEKLRAKPPSIIMAESIGSAAESLGDMFGALTAGDAVILPEVVAAGAEVTDAIGDVGFPDWVDEVRRHHEGTFQHCLIVTGLASAFGRSTGMGRRDTVTLTTAGLLHDIGKAAVPVAILDKPGKLSPAEFEIVRSHPGRGWEHLRGTDGIDDDVLRAVRGHHEFLDGSGYPDGIGGSEIGDLTRVLTICDVYGALIERRAYKPPATVAEAVGILDAMAGEGKVEAALVRAFHHTVTA